MLEQNGTKNTPEDRLRIHKHESSSGSTCAPTNVISRHAPKPLQLSELGFSASAKFGATWCVS